MDARTILDLAFRTSYPRLLAVVARRYPGLCSGSVADAVGHAFEVAIGKPESVEDAWRTGGEYRVRGLLQVIAVRRARDIQRTASRRGVVSLELVGEGWARHEAGQEAVVHAHAVLPDVVERAAKAVVKRSDPTPLVEALQDRILTGDSDTEVSQRHGIHRSTLNRAKRWMMRELLEV